jgi:hypothetical protein
VASIAAARGDDHKQIRLFASAVASGDQEAEIVICHRPRDQDNCASNPVHAPRTRQVIGMLGRAPMKCQGGMSRETRNSEPLTANRHLQVLRRNRKSHRQRSNAQVSKN